jgi:formylglycine-generating enzyme required for sulfatase activity
MPSRVKINLARRKQTFTYFRENLGGVFLDMLLIPGGSFVMGAPITEAESRDKERPQHEVKIAPFFMGRYPITQAQWRAIALLDTMERELNPNPAYFQGDNRPVEHVNWQDCLEFCARLSKYTGKNYRLPSEAEWEYACRAGSTTPFHFGETLSTEVANYDGTFTYGSGIVGKNRAVTVEVGSLGGVNAFGLSDMHGQVWEWCLDPWHDNYYGAPTDGSVWDGQNSSDYLNILDRLSILILDERAHVIRGGSYLNAPRGCRSAFRNYYDEVSYLDVGLRVVCLP